MFVRVGQNGEGLPDISAISPERPFEVAAGVHTLQVAKRGHAHMHKHVHVYVGRCVYRHVHRMNVLRTEPTA